MTNGPLVILTDKPVPATYGYFGKINNHQIHILYYRILFSAPFACGAYFCLWYVPDLSEAGKFGWYFVFYCSFQALLSVSIKQK